jgi:hypothetical protein
MRRTYHADCALAMLSSSLTHSMPGRKKSYVVHEEHERSIRPETQAEMRRCDAVEFYSGVLHWDRGRPTRSEREARAPHTGGDRT